MKDFVNNAKFFSKLKKSNIKNKGKLITKEERLQKELLHLKNKSLISLVKTEWMFQNQNNQVEFFRKQPDIRDTKVIFK